MLRLRIPLPRLLSAGEILQGPGSIGALRALGAARVAVISEAPLTALPDFQEKLSRALGAHEHRFIEKEPGEPTLRSLQPVIAELVDLRPDWIVAIGGGSVIDAGKLAWAFYEHPSVEPSRLTRAFGLPPLRGQARFVAVPTTAGTGAEVSSAAVFLDEESGRKRAVVAHDLLPDIAILDPTFAITAPASVTATSGLDALAHAVEGYVSRFDNPLLDRQAETAARMIFNWLPRCMQAPTDLTARQELQNAALLAGWVQNLKVPGAGHAVAHQLGQFGVPHGLACGALLSASIRYNATDVAVRAKYDHLAGALGFGLADDLARSIDVLRQQLGIAAPLSTRIEGGAQALWSHRSEVARGALEDICAKANPRPLDEAAVFTMLEAVL